MRRLIAQIVTASALLALPALAGEPLDAAAFEARTEGKTILFSVGGETYGGEEYLPGHRVRWSFLDGRCKDGRWYEEAGQICFVYEDTQEPHCWRFYDEGGQLVAEFAEDPEGTRFYATSESEEPLYCMGPDLGV